MQDLTRMICEEQAGLTVSILSRTKLESKVCFRTKKKKSENKSFNQQRSLIRTPPNVLT